MEIIHWEEGKLSIGANKKLTLIERKSGAWSPPQDFNHPDYLFQSRYVTPWFKPISFDTTHNATGKRELFFTALRTTKQY